MASRTAKAERVAKVLLRLQRSYPDAKLALHFSSPLELLISLILAAQCTDEKVNEVTRTIVFKKYRKPEDYVRVPVEELEVDIHSTGFFRNKARALQGCCRALIENFGGQVPSTQKELLTIPGVGRKTANILLGNAFGMPAIGVDTHVLRLSQRLGLSQQTDPDKVEDDLNLIVPKLEQTRFCTLIQAHGRKVCVARKPRCPECSIADLCPFPDKTPAEPVRPPKPAFGRKLKHRV
ncbi:MAG: endonuclease III [Deltaproteobacteria bacterium]|nr:endonuclease III [Deltaproteobacteria bacterium]